MGSNSFRRKTMTYIIATMVCTILFNTQLVLYYARFTCITFLCTSFCLLLSMKIQIYAAAASARSSLASFDLPEIKMLV